MLDFVAAQSGAVDEKMEGTGEIAQKRLGDSSTEAEVGGKRIRFDNEDYLSNNEEN